MARYPYKRWDIRSDDGLNTSQTRLPLPGWTTLEIIPILAKIKTKVKNASIAKISVKILTSRRVVPDSIVDSSIFVCIAKSPNIISWFVDSNLKKIRTNQAMSINRLSPPGGVHLASH